jgi:hypothetical protein
MHWPLVVLFVDVALGARFRFFVRRYRRCEGIGVRFGLCLGKCLDRFIGGDIFAGLRGVRDGHRGAWTDHGFGILAGERARLASPRRRRPRALVLVIRLARRAARLLHFVVDHRNDGVVGDAALARAIVVENVTEADPALLHYSPGAISLQGTPKRSDRL